MICQCDHGCEDCDPRYQVAYLECIDAQEAVYWENRRQKMGLTDKQIGDLLRVAAPHLLKETDTLREALRAYDEHRITTRDLIEQLRAKVELLCRCDAKAGYTCVGHRPLAAVSAGEGTTA